MREEEERISLQSQRVVRQYSIQFRNHDTIEYLHATNMRGENWLVPMIV